MNVAKFGVMLLLLSNAISAVASIVMLISPSVLPDAWLRSGGSDVLIRAWATTWLALSAVLLIVLKTSFRRGARLPWILMWIVPIVWFSHFLLAPGSTYNLVLAIVTCVALAMTYRFAWNVGAQ